MLPLSDSLTTYLRKYDSRVDRSGNAYFFPALHGECYSPVTIRNTFRKLMAQAEIPLLPTGKYPRIHDLRHTFAVHSLEQSIEHGLDPYCSLPAAIQLAIAVRGSLSSSAIKLMKPMK